MIYFKKSLKSVRVSKRMSNSLLDLAGVIKIFKNSYHVLLYYQFFLFYSIYNIQSSSNLNKVHSWPYVYHQLFITLCSISFCNKVLKRIVYSLSPNTFFTFFYKSIPIRSLPHRSTEIAPITIITTCILLNTMGHPQSL